MLFDLRYNGCNYADQTDCGDRWFKDIIRVKQILVERLLFRPICGACDEGCVYQTTTTTTATTTPVSNVVLTHSTTLYNLEIYFQCGHEESQCDIFGAGTHPDPFNCRFVVFS